MTNDNVRRYRGGAFAQLWRFDVQGKSEAVPLFPGNVTNNKRPMWWQGRLYFVSDRGGADNLWTAKDDGSEPRSLTSHTGWDVRNATMGDGRVVYQLGADLHVFDIARGSDKTLSINLVSDFDQQRARQIKSPLEQLTNIQLSNKDERIVITARGRVSIAGTAAQRRIEIAVPPSSRARDAVFSADDKWIYAIVDTTGENEVWRFPANGAGPGEALTRNGDQHRWQIFPSPDGKWLAHSDKRGRLWLLDLATRQDTVIDDAGKVGVNRHENVIWSPDSRALAIVRSASDQRREQIGLYGIDSKQLEFVTGDRYESTSPAFSPDGRWLYFLSDRNFSVSNRDPWGDRNMGPVFDRRTGIFALALQPGNRFQFKADDELSKTPAPDKVEPKDETKLPAGDVPKKAVAPAPKVPATPAIVFAGLAQRLFEVPLVPGNYSAMTTDGKRLYFLERDTPAEAKYTLKTLAINKTGPEPEVFAAGVRGYDLSSDLKRIFYRSFAVGTGDLQIVEAGAKQPTDISKAKIKVDDWSFNANPREEWRQMFGDAWRLHRDFLYDSKMRGVDWIAVRAKYAPLVERVSDRAELNDILGMMVSEIGTLHSQIRPGDIRRTAADGVPGELGAVLARVPEGVRIDRIYQSAPELPSEHGPLEQPDLDVRVGDIITAINGRPVNRARSVVDLLLNQAGKQVLLEVKRGAAAPTSMIVTPISVARHNSLRYSDWENSRSARVSAASQGRIGYLHLRAMGGGDIATFAREFYSNITREGLIIDVRRNTGGNIDSWIIEKLLRKAWAFWSPPNRQPYPNMQQTFRGHLVVLVDELTYSDGETFAAGVQALGLGPVVGKRTAGAGVWLSDNNDLSDNGMVRVAENGQFGADDGKQLIEGVGVTPDVEVDNLPHATFNGHDQQLEVALQLLQKKMKEKPMKPYAPQPIPAQARW